MFDKFITGAVIALIFIGTPFLYKLGKKKRQKLYKKERFIMDCFGAEFYYYLLLE